MYVIFWIVMQRSVLALTACQRDTSAQSSGFSQGVLGRTWFIWEQELDRTALIVHSEQWFTSALTMELVFSSETVAHNRNNTSSNYANDNIYLKGKKSQLSVLILFISYFIIYYSIQHFNYLYLVCLRSLLATVDAIQFEFLRSRVLQLRIQRDSSFDAVSN